MTRRSLAVGVAAAVIAVGAVLGLVTARAGEPAASGVTRADRHFIPSGDTTEPVGAATARPADVLSTERPTSAPEGSVGHQSARIEDLEPEEKPRPTRLRIAALGINAPIAAYGVAANGEMDVPTDAGTVAWYEHGPAPGHEGSAVLAAHVDYNGRKGVFFNLADLRAGETVTVAFDTGAAQTFTVTDGASVAKQALPVEQLFRRDGPPLLTLITCGGDFDRATRSYRNNVVVRAKPSAPHGSGLSQSSPGVGRSNRKTKGGAAGAYL